MSPGRKRPAKVLSPLCVLLRAIAVRTESAGWRAVTKSRRAWRAIRMRMEEAMCRIGAIKSKVPVEPAKALYLMLPQQEGHDNSGYAMVMQDLYGVFEGHKDKPLLSQIGRASCRERV